MKNKYKYIARIDNDMFVPKHLIYELVKRLENNKKIAGLSPKVMFADNPNIIWFGGTKIGNNLKLQKECSNHICKKKRYEIIQRFNRNRCNCRVCINNEFEIFKKSRSF